MFQKSLINKIHHYYVYNVIKKVISLGNYNEETIIYYNKNKT